MQKEDVHAPMDEHRCASPFLSDSSSSVGFWEWHRTTDRADVGQQSRIEGCGKVSWINVRGGSVRPPSVFLRPTPTRARHRSQAL